MDLLNANAAFKTCRLGSGTIQNTGGRVPLAAKPFMNCVYDFIIPILGIYSTLSIRNGNAVHELRRNTAQHGAPAASLLARSANVL
jgi:hypothetical protein